MKSGYKQYWIVNGDSVAPFCGKKQVKARQNGKPPVEYYRNMFGETIPARRVREWKSLTGAQKIRVYKDSYDFAVLSAKFECAKDATLKPLLPKWLADAREKYESAVAAINVGEDVDPPEAI